MRRNRTTDAENYIRVRMSQLIDESNKCHDPHDAMWYNRIAQELSWVLQVIKGGKSD